MATRLTSSRSLARFAVASVLILAATLLAPLRGATAADASCAGLNAIACENTKPGTPRSVWDIRGAGDDSIQGFSTDISYDVGDIAAFKIKTDASAYTIDIYRLGWYGGDGARKVASVAPSTTLPQVQPACASDPSTGLYDCGTWGVSATWDIPADAVSGVYVARLHRADLNDMSHITFVVRDDASTSDVMFQTSDPTWQAYNQYGGADMYMNTGTFSGTGQARAFKVSYNRPIATRSLNDGRDFLFSNEFPMLQFMERNGLDVSYTSGLDSARRGSLIKNHHVFVSTGHDEYWSGAQRANVEAARDAGVNLAFFSGNEVYWRTRYEPSIDGTTTADRTLVTYKETWSDAKVDPSSEWTGTWRDPRFATKAQGGGLPENALTGTLYMANNTDLPVTVTQAEAQLRLWRGTGLSSMTTATTALAPHTVGYESDEDLDNGARPAGLVQLSTTVGATPQYLRDYGRTVTPGTTTHHVTLYRAPSGALVFGAGTVQWAWGLSADHDGAGAPADPRMQQATLNVLSDMGAQPTTLMAGLTNPQAAADTTAPTTVITTPAAGATIGNGSRVTVTGTASDVGGQVAGVEVSTDEGVTWHPATGRASWTYTYTQPGDGTVSLRARAVDDSANIGTAVTRALQVTCPCSLLGQATPGTASVASATAVELGVRFTSSRAGYVYGVRFYKGAANTGTHTGTLWSSTGTQLATGTFVDETESGWQTLEFANPIAVSAGTTYVASYFAPGGRYAADSNAFTTSDITSAPLTAPGRPSGGLNGVYANAHRFPASSYGDTNYWVDVVFANTDTSPPALTAQTPLPGASSVPANVVPSATFGAEITPSTLSFSLTGPAGAVAGTTAYDPATQVATFTPAAALGRGDTYTATVSARSANDVPMASPRTWSFVVAQPAPTPGVCPCSLWNDGVAPATTTVTDQASVELGVRFTPDVDGTISGVRFYKGPKNLGTHTGSLWSSTGTQLATATFTGESSTGWQTVTFASPVTVSAGATYTASYRAPLGAYSVTTNAFSSVGLDAPPLHVGVRGGAYTYAASAAPTNASASNYSVDVVFNAADAAPGVTSTSPTGGETLVGSSPVVSATFSAPPQSGTPAISLQSAAGAAVAGTTTYDAPSRTISLRPTAALAAGATYTATVSGAKAVSGAVMAPYSWSFTTASSGCPCTLLDPSSLPATVDGGATASIEVGTKFAATVNGSVTGVRFYKAVKNTGTHVGSLWSSTGTKLATVTFTNESPFGWQTASFSSPVAVTPGATYVVSYLAPVGHYSASTSFFANAYARGPLTAPAGTNGVFLNGAGGFPTSSYKSTSYWVEPVFMTTATPPGVTAQTPVDGASSVPTSTTATATFSLAVDPASVELTVTGASSGPRAGAVTYDAASRTATFTPSAALPSGDTYTVSVRATATDGTAMPAPRQFTFTSAAAAPAPGVCPCGLWNDGTQPAVPSWNDAASVEVGTRFSADVAGSITGVRFFKGPKNPGPHTVSMWTAGGTLLASATSTTESTTGWQTVRFNQAVPVSARVSYVVSYRAPSGGYAATTNGLAAAVDAPPLHTAARAAVYTYGSGFPTGTSNTNYWVDPVFTR